MPRSSDFPPRSVAERKLQKLQLVRDLRAELARQEAAEAAARAHRYRNDPCAWVDERLGEFFWSGQRKIAETVRDNRRTAIRSGHGVGKSHGVSRLAGWWIDTHPPGEAFVVT